VLPLHNSLPVGDNSAVGTRTLSLDRQLTYVLARTSISLATLALPGSCACAVSSVIGSVKCLLFCKILTKIY